MQFTDILNFCFSILGLYCLVHYLRLLIPRNVLPHVSAVLTEAEHLLDRAESTGVIPQPNDYRSALTLYASVTPLPMNCHLTDRRSHANQLLRIRMESHRAPGISQQLRLAIQCGLTCKLYTLSSRVEAVKVKIEVRWNPLFIPTISEGRLQQAVDRQRLISLTTRRSATTTALPTSAEGTRPICGDFGLGGCLLVIIAAMV